jgi:polycomb protein EED
LPRSQGHNRGKEQREEGEESEQEGPRKPDILPQLLLMARLGPGQGLGCEAAEGSLVPTRKREYKPCGKHTEGKRPLYAVGFNFMDARYYDVFATVGGNHVSFRFLTCLLSL